jgi:RHS repeat-associated protein
LKVNYNYSTVSDGAQGYLKTVSNNATGNNYWQAKAQNAAGQLTEIELGNGLTTQYVYDANTDLINTIKTGTAQAPNSIQHLGFEFDSIGNLTTRTDYTQIVNGLATNWLSESFQYDLLNRMTQSHVNGQSAKTYQYDALGNITFKTGVGNYSYGNNAGPHAVTQTNLNGTLTNYTYDANGSMISGNGRAISYSSFNKPTNISTANSDISFQYGADRSRVSRTDNTTGKTRYYIGSLFEVETHSSLTTYTHFIKAAGSTVAIETSKSDNSHTLRYLHKDHLGSITHMTDEQGLVTETQSYDPHGKRRNADWSDITGNPSSSATTDRGFTGHEHIDEVNLIHMNGRVYDPTLGRFISADPFIQAPLNSQSLNRYSYVMNNPLSYTDPSGFFFKSIFKAVKKLVKGIAKAVKNVVSAIAGSPIGRIVVTAVVCQGNPACYAAISGAFTAANGGSIKDILKSAAVAYVQAQAFDLVGTEFPGPIENVIAHGVVGGAFSEIQGGNFFSGFVSGGFGAFASNELDLGFFGTMVAGGVGSVLGGGKFQNGAVTAAFGYVHNCLKHPNVCSGKIRHQEIETLDIHSPQPELVVDVGGGGISKFAATLKRFWDKSLKFQGNKVFQRNDLIDPGKIDPKTGLSNLDLMKAGRAPIGPDDKPINLHHMIQKHNGAIAEMTQTFHQKNSKIIHINPSSTPSGINRAEFNKWRARYWRERSKDF